MHFQQLSCIRNNFGDQPARPAPTSAPPRNPGFGQARLRLRLSRSRLPALGSRVGGPVRASRRSAARRTHDNPHGGCAQRCGRDARRLLRERLRSQGTPALARAASAPCLRGPPIYRAVSYKTFRLNVRLKSGNGIFIFVTPRVAMASVINRPGLPRLRLRRATQASDGCASSRATGCAGSSRDRLRTTTITGLRPVAGGTALPGNGCAPRERLRSQGTAALPGDGCAPRGRLRRSQGTAAFSGGGCSSRQVDKDCVFEPAGPAGANLTSRGTHRTGTIEPPIAGRSMCPARGEPQDQGHFTLRSKDRYR